MSYKKLGEGSFGCVVNQPLCSKYKTKKGMITKLLRKTKNNNYKHELKLSKKLKESKRFCTIEDHCFLKHNEIPISVRSNNLSLNKNKCYITRIDPNKSKKINYISFLMPYCGKPLTSDTIQFFLKNEFISFIKQLLNGLVYTKKQRIVLARSFYFNKEILIMDESTSSLDVETEKEIINELKNIKGKITIIIIAHRQSTIEYCDQIYRISNNSIIQEN